MNRPKTPPPPKTAPNVKNKEQNACAVDLPGSQKISFLFDLLPLPPLTFPDVKKINQFLFSRALAPLTFPEVKNIQSIIFLWR